MRMILSKRILLLVAACFVYFSWLLITKRCTQESFEARLRGEFKLLKRITFIDDPKSESHHVKALMTDFQKSRLFRPAKGNAHWKHDRNLLENLATNDVSGVGLYPRKIYPLPPKNAVLNIAWFSMRTFWRVRRYPILFPCDTGKVYMTKSELDPGGLRGADVVLFAGGFDNVYLWRQLQAQRDPGQLWLFNTDESPMTARTHIPPSYLRDITFNITFTYRSNADISTPYGYFLKNKTGKRVMKMKMDFHVKSPKLAAWMSSHCDTIAWNRTGFIWDLSKFITIDKYGSCGNLTCGNAEKYWERVVNNQCKRILRQYKFHFALENSCCTEYISEKFWNILRHYDAIPVVVGARREDYESIAPPHSFIYAADFDTMEELADYLKLVASDPDLFNSFFQWRYEGVVQGNHEKQRRIGYTAANCRILEYLQRPNITQGRHDLHGPAWMGGCSECAEHTILKDYRSSGYSYVQN